MNIIHILAFTIVVSFPTLLAQPKLTPPLSHSSTTNYSALESFANNGPSPLSRYIYSHSPTIDITYNVSNISNSVLTNELLFDVVIHPIFLTKDFYGSMYYQHHAVTNIAITYETPFSLTTFKDYNLQLLHDANGYSYISPAIIDNLMPYIFCSNRAWGVFDSNNLLSLCIDTGNASVINLSDIGIISAFYYSRGDLYVLLRKNDVVLNDFVYVGLDINGAITSNIYHRQKKLSQHILGNRGIYILDGTRIVLLNEDTIIYDIPYYSGKCNYNMSLYTDENSDRVTINNEDICYVLTTNSGKWEILYEIQVFDKRMSKCYYWKEGIIEYDIRNGDVEYFNHEGQKIKEINIGIELNPIQLAIFDKYGNGIIGYSEGIIVIVYESGGIKRYEMDDNPGKVHEDERNIYIQTMQGGLYKVHNPDN